MRKLSDKIYSDSCACIPGGVNSPVRSFPGLQMTPIIAERGAGDIVFDVDGKSYIDFCCSWGALILGHAHPSIVSAACAQVARGSSFGMATPYELELAKKIQQHLPSIEKIRFVSSGTEACMSAVRLARGFTGKKKVIKFNGNFHGHSDGFLIRAGSGVHELPNASSSGVLPELVQHTISLPYNDIELARACLQSYDDIAAVILEPIVGNMGVIIPSREFISMLREETGEKNIVLIFDEVITGFRVGLHGAQGYFGVTPDLTCLAKIIGGGFPAAAFGGRREIMDHLAPLGSVYQGGTLSGNPVAMVAGLAALKEVEKPGFYEELERKTTEFLKPLRPLCNVQQIGSMFTLFVPEYKTLFRKLFDQGIYFPPLQQEACFISSAHTEEHLKQAQEVCKEILLTI
ncbi:MAG: glutamate-1-semialdehyde 2,1-aminomutase [Verrucomicrobia bacterium]|nr:glutamate-1-semialdehyde 2,1-aminomutase [Verrucomicrobiota bacterium]